jgi:hypothetical protein
MEQHLQEIRIDGTSILYGREKRNLTAVYNLYSNSISIWPFIFCVANLAPRGINPINVD